MEVVLFIKEVMFMSSKSEDIISIKQMQKDRRLRQIWNS